MPSGFGTATQPGSAGRNTPPDTLMQAEVMLSNRTATGNKVVKVAGEALAFGEVVYFKSDGKAWRADADGSSTFPAMARSLGTVAAGNSGTFLLSGNVRNDAWSWTSGGTVYLSTTVGAMTQTAPSSPNTVQILGVAHPNADTVCFTPADIAPAQAAAAGTLTGATLASNVLASSLTSVGTLASGSWNATTIPYNKGGTGLTALGSSLQVLRTNSAANAMEFATVAGSAMTLVSTLTLSSSSSAEYTAFSSASYQNYLIVYVDCYMGTNGTFSLEASQDNGSSYNTSTITSVYTRTNGTTVTTSGNSGVTYSFLSNLGIWSYGGYAFFNMGSNNAIYSSNAGGPFGWQNTVANCVPGTNALRWSFGTNATGAIKIYGLSN